MSPTKRSGSRTVNASPLGNHATTEESSFRTISINLRGKGFEPVVGVDGLLTGDEDGEIAGDTACPLLLPPVLRESRRADCCASSESSFNAEDAEIPGPIVTTPAAPTAAPRG